MQKNLRSQFKAPPFYCSSRLRAARLLIAFLPAMMLAYTAQAQFAINFDVTEPACFGLPTGSVTANPVGGQAPYDYLWSTGETTQTISNIPAGVYTVTVTDDNSVEVIEDVTVDQPDLVTVTLVANECELPIIITATGDGGMPPYNYSWSIPGASGSVVQAPGPGTYCVTMTDQNLCGAVECITVDFDPLSVDVVATDVTCTGDDDGSIEATPTGGSAPYTFLWSNGATTATQTGLAPGTYTVTVTDASGCEASGQGTVSEPPPLQAVISSNNPNCTDDNNGSATVTASGGTPPYSYLWNTGQTSTTITGLNAGMYSVTVTDANNCVISVQTTLVPVSSLSLVITVNDESCPDENDGSITATPSDGVPPYSYSWSNGMTGQTITNLVPGTYMVTVTDAAGCTATESATVEEAAPLNISISSSNVTFCTFDNGSATVNVDQGEGPFTFNWSNGETTQTITDLAAGVYSVTVTDANNCTETASVVINPPPSIDVSVSANTMILCPGDNSGTATATVSGGTPPFVYQWSNGETTSEITGLGAGTYSVTVTDAALCEASSSVTINEAPAISASVTGQELVCDPMGSGSASVSVSGGTPPFQFLWNTGATTQAISGLDSGTYTATVTDAQGCTAVDSITIVVVDDFTLNTAVQNVLCFGESTGSIMAEGVGGTPPYTYMWSTGATGTPMIDNLPAGDYSVTVTEQNGCQLVESFTITEPTLLQATINGSSDICPGESNGTLTAIGTGGTMPYSYEWSTGATTQQINNLPAGTYTVTITDANSCTADANFTIGEFDAVIVNVDAPEIVCGAGATGSAMAEVSGGSAPYFYSWSTGESGPELDQIENLPQGTYFVTVTDANGCTATGEATIEVVDDFSVSVSPRDVLCFGGNSGSILLIPSGGDTPYSFDWSTGDTTNEIINLPIGTYSYTVTDANGCEIIGSEDISEPPLLELGLEATNIDCSGDDNGQITATAMGGTPPYSYDWSNGDETATIIDLAPGTYVLTVTDANFCTVVDSATIIEPAPIDITLTANDALCFGESTGSVSSMVNGGTAPLTYEWSTGATTTAISDVPAGTYSLTVTDANTCRAVATATVGEPDELNVSLDITDVFCDDTNTGAITANPTGGTAPFTYEWSNTQTGQTITDLGAGDYTVTVTDVNECSVVATGTVEFFPGLTLTPIASSPNCFGESTGAAAVSVAGGTPPFTYEWDNGSTTPELINIPSGVYTVTVTDDVGCRGVETVGVVDPAELIGEVAASQTQDPSCNGSSDGQASVSVTGGTPPYTFNWSTGATTQTIDGLSAGTYDVTITDNNGCTDELSVTLDEPTAISIDINLDNANTCEGSSDGSAVATASGGTAPYTYSWSTGDTGDTVSGLAAGTYTVSATDANNCVATTTVIINSFPTPTCSIEIVSEVSLTGNDGELAINVTGGTPPYTYLWGGGQTSQSLSGLSPGDYSATVTDANGCQTSCSVTLQPPAQIGDFVWNDEDRDGIQDPNEDGIEGVTVILQLPGESNPIDIDTAFTDADGFYIFNVMPGEYKVTFILPDGLVFTGQNEGTDDALDSDPDPIMGMTDVIIIGPGEINLTIDAGMYTKCDNIDDPGLIGPNQFLCGPGNDPDPLVNIESPSGGSGQLEYLWMKSTIPGPFNIQTWEVIPGADGPEYDPGPLSETTYFARCARRECCTVYLESNIVTIEVGNVAVAEINGPDFICVGEPTTFFAGPTGAGAVIEWSFSAGVSPQSETGPQATIQVNSLGSYTITLTVTENGCTSTDIETINATNSPIYCGGSMGLVAEVEDEASGQIQVSWMVEEFLRDHTFTVQHSINGEDFEDLAVVERPAALLGVMNYYELMHESAKQGRNIYRIQIENREGELFYSEEAEAILYGDSKVALLYPNPVDDIATLELFETFGEEATAELINANGAVILRQQAGASTKQLQFDLSELPSGTYFLRLNYSRTGNKVYKLMKR